MGYSTAVSVLRCANEYDPRSSRIDSDARPCLRDPWITCGYFPVQAVRGEQGLGRNGLAAVHGAADRDRSPMGTSVPTQPEQSLRCPYVAVPGRSRPTDYFLPRSFRAEHLASRRLRSLRP